MQMLRSSILLFIIFTLISGLFYPLSVTLLAGRLFVNSAKGSIIYRDQIPIGSNLIGQSFTEDKYFWGRPSAANYAGLKSGGANLGPTNPKLFDTVKKRLVYLEKSHEKRDEGVPIDLLFSSASGLDPDISIDAAMYQLSRVADKRGLSRVRLVSLIKESISPRTFGFLGEPRVNVLALNIAVDKLGDSSGK